MGTLFNQSPRKYLYVNESDLHREMEIIFRLYNDFSNVISIDQLIKLREILENKRKNDLFVHNGDALDEQLAGFGELFAKFIELYSADIQDKISSSHSFITPKMPFGGATYDDMVEAEIERLSEKD